MGIKYQAPAIASGFLVGLYSAKAMQQLAVSSCYVDETARNFEKSFLLV